MRKDWTPTAYTGLFDKRGHNMRAWLVWLTATVLAAGAGCGSSDGADGTEPVDGTGGTAGQTQNTPSGDEELDTLITGIDAVLAEEGVSEDATSPLAPGRYVAIAGRMASLSGVASAVYMGDVLGTVSVHTTTGIGVVWRHVPDTFGEMALVPSDTDFSEQAHPEWNAGWRTNPEEQQDIGPELRDGMRMQNAYATHFPTATSDPDLEFKKDDQLSCPTEGKIAFVDFIAADDHFDSGRDFSADGHDVMDRVQWMAEAAGFQVDIFRDTELNLSNFKQLEDYDVVYTLGHGGLTNADETLKAAGYRQASLLWTKEIYDPDKATAMGMSYREALRQGLIEVTPKNKYILLKSMLFAKHLQPKRDQMWMVNHCWSMLPYEMANPEDSLEIFKALVTARDHKVFSVGDGLKAGGVRVVMGYVGPAEPRAVVGNTISFFRRMFGGYSQYDRPPSPHVYWPGCMTPNTYFRWNPFVDDFIWVMRSRSIFTMYADVKGVYFRKVCEGGTGGAHASLQSFMLEHGTPATALPLCWQQYWSKGESPSGLVDPLCSQGDSETTEEVTNKAACLVKIDRKATNALLRQ